eukprot:8160898-Alexandrium_andersonii.AAC.1
MLKQLRAVHIPCRLVVHLCRRASQDHANVKLARAIWERGQTLYQILDSPVETALPHPRRPPPLPE